MPFGRVGYGYAKCNHSPRRAQEKNFYDPELPSESNAHWLPWLEKELLIRDITAQTPEIPLSFEPKWDLWCKEIARYDIARDTILVGHSAGAGFWLKYLTTHPKLSVGTVVLVAPWFDPDKTLEENFFDAWDADPDVAARTDRLIVFINDDDSDSTQKSVDWISKKIRSIEIRRFHGLGNFNYDNLGGSAFPELLVTLLNNIPKNNKHT